MKMKKPGSRLGNALPKMKKESPTMEMGEGPMFPKEEMGEVHKMAGRPAKTAIKSVDGLKAFYKKKFGK